MNGWLLLAPLLLGLPLLGFFSVLVGGVGVGRFGSVRVGAREGLLWAAVLWATVATLIATSLSVGAGHDPLAETGGHLSRGPLAVVWGVAALLGAVASWRRRAVLIEVAATARERLGTFTRFERFLLGFSVASVAIVSLIGLISAPTTWDSMTYHLARVAVWLQLGGSSHYATSAEPQLFQPPGAELLIAQLQALTGGDRLAAGVQSVAFALTIVAATSIARSLGGGERAQLLAAFLTATTPMAIMQGSSTQNDLLVGLWLMVVGALALTLLDAGERTLTTQMRSAVAAVAVALAIVTKGTAWVYLPPLLILLAVAIVRSGRWRGFAASALVGVLTLALLAGPSMLANHQTFGKYVFTGSGAFDYGADIHTPASLASNLVRNAAIHLGTPIKEVNDRTTQLIDDALGIVGIDADAAATTFPGQRFTVPLAGPEEGHAPDPLLFTLGLLALAMTFFSPAFRTHRRVAWAVVVLGGIAIFALLFKWQPFHSRLHLPAELLMVPLAAVALDRAWHDRRGNALLISATCTIAAIVGTVFLLLNVDRPLIGRAGHPSILTTPHTQQYFAQRPEFAEPYTKIVERMRERGDRQLALVGGFDDWYYPFSALSDGRYRVSYTLVPNPSARYPQVRPQDSSALVCINCDLPTQLKLSAAGLERETGMSFRVPATKDRGGAVIELWERPRD